MKHFLIPNLLQRFCHISSRFDIPLSFFIRIILIALDRVSDQMPDRYFCFCKQLHLLARQLKELSTFVVGENCNCWDTKPDLLKFSILLINMVSDIYHLVCCSLNGMSGSFRRKTKVIKILKTNVRRDTG